MTRKGKKYRPEYSRVLLNIAKGDLASARVLSAATEGRPENTIYMAQQCVEKALKAVLCATGLLVPFTHDIEVLVTLLPEHTPLPDEAQSLTELTEFATIRRYEEGHYEYTQEDLAAVLQASEAAWLWADATIGGLAL